MDESADVRRILTAVPQNDWKRPTGRPHTSWLTTMKNDLSFHNPSVEECTQRNRGALHNIALYKFLILFYTILFYKMPPSWHWTGHSGGYWPPPQAQLRTKMVQVEQWWWWISVDPV